jgi:hypothetical protein
MNYRELLIETEDNNVMLNRNTPRVAAGVVGLQQFVRKNATNRL